MSEQFSLLWGKILRSSLWIQESKETRLVWITLLALRDRDGQIQSSVVGLADSAKVSVAECKEALVVLMAPDPDDTSKVDEGRRIREIAGGWQIVNHDKYRFGTEEKRLYWAARQANRRARLKAQEELGKSKRVGKGGARERNYDKAHGDGNVALTDRIASGDL